MENKVYKQLLMSYYVAFAMFFIVFLVCFKAVASCCVEISQDLKIFLQSFGIMYVLLSIPFALWYFHRIVAKTKDDVLDVKIKKYRKVALLRIFLIAFGVMLNVVLFCFLKDMSMFYCSVIAALAFIFCKPQKEKMEHDLSNEEPNNEEE